MIETSQLLLFTLAAAALVAAPGPDMLLALGRGLGQGRLAGAISGLGSGIGILTTSVLVAFGLAALLETSVVAFTVMKFAGAGYLVWLGIKTLRERSLFSPKPAKPASNLEIFVLSVVNNILNPKVALFMVAFLPQFVRHDAPDVVAQTVLLGSIFAVITVIAYATLGIAAASLTRQLERRPRIVAGFNIGAGIAFVLSGLKVASIESPH